MSATMAGGSLAEDRTGAEVLARMLNDYGVTLLFMVPAVLRRTLRELELHTRVARIHAHGDKPAAYMADGYVPAFEPVTKFNATIDDVARIRNRPRPDPGTTG